MPHQKLLSVLAAAAALIVIGGSHDNGVVHAFASPRALSSALSHPMAAAYPSSSSSSSLGMAPKFDTATQKWFVTDPEKEGPSAGYGLVGSLYRAGPVPFFQRIVNAEAYEQAVLKYMAQEGCDRMEAQGNMDAYFENPQDWAYQKMDEKRGAPKRDYANANMNPQQIILSTVWACIVVAFFYDAITGVAEGRYGKADGTTIFNGNLWQLPF